MVPKSLHRLLLFSRLGRGHWHRCFVHPATLFAAFVASATQASADSCRSQSRQLTVHNYGTPSPCSITISFVACSIDPIAPCHEAMPEGCGDVECSVTVNAQQPDESAMALAIAYAINAAGCAGYSASYEGASTFNIFYPDDVCSCILDSDTGVATPFSSACGFIFACNGIWAFEWTWCPVSPQPYCLDETAFGPEAVTITFDDLPDGVLLSNEFAGLLFEHAVVEASGFAITPPNRIVSDYTIVPRPAIRITFDPPVLRVGCNVDNDGYTGERQPQLLACGTRGSAAVCDFEQGPDFKGIELPDCEQIASMELGGFAWGICRWGGTDGFDNLVFVRAICGDMDANRLVDPNDVGIFVQTLLGLDADACHLAAADVNADGLLDGRDIESFVACVVP